jgi:hypothetical protein
MSKAKKTLLLAGASAFAILASVAGVNAETPGRYDFLVPVSGKYEVLAFGASGGSIQNPGAVGGLGAGVGGELFLTAGQHLTLFVGGMGADGVSMDGAGYGGGGGGGSFIFLGAGTTDLLVAAGGGGGAGFLAAAVPNWPGRRAATVLACQALPGGQAASTDWVAARGLSDRETAAAAPD